MMVLHTVHLNIQVSQAHSLGGERNTGKGKKVAKRCNEVKKSRDIAAKCNKERLDT